MPATNLIELTDASDGSKVQVSVLQIIHVHPYSTGASVEFANGYTIHVTESPSAVRTAANG